MIKFYQLNTTLPSSASVWLEWQVKDSVGMSALLAAAGEAGRVFHYPNIESISFVAHLVFFPTLRTERGRKNKY